MPSLTTQSIGISVAPIAGSHPAAQIRAREAATQAGVQRAQNQARASSSATQALSDSQRSVQEEKRAEGTFADGEEREESQQPPDALRKPGSSFSKIA
jgi:hypothetical protein